MYRRQLCVVLALAMCALAVTPAFARPAAPPGSPAQRAPVEQLDRLERVVRDAMVDAGFDQLIDQGPARRGLPIARMPHVDVAVLELNPAGQVVAAANVLLAGDLADGRVVPVDRPTLSTSAIRYAAWDIGRWDAGDEAYAAPFVDADIIAGPLDAPTTFMTPYPASLFKLIVAYHVMTLVDDGAVSLDTAFTYVPSGQTETVGTWLDEMITISDNRATEALLALLHELDEVDRMNAEMQRLGMPTLQINGTQPVTGRPWNPGSIHMGSLDTAKLLLLIRGGPGVLWRTPEGVRVTADELSTDARTFLRGLLADQGLKEVLATSMICDGPGVVPGIPAAVPDRFVDPETGFADVGGVPFEEYDVRPCNDAAEVLFEHKTGLTINYGSDAGIVTALDGERRREYVIAFTSNLGYRYADADLVAEAAGISPYPCFAFDVCYTQRIPGMAATIDAAMPTRGPRR